MALNGEINSNDNFVRHTFPVADVLKGDQISYLILLPAEGSKKKNNSLKVFYSTIFLTRFLGPQFADGARHEDPAPLGGAVPHQGQHLLHGGHGSAELLPVEGDQHLEVPHRLLYLLLGDVADAVTRIILAYQSETQCISFQASLLYPSIVFSDGRFNLNSLTHFSLSMFTIQMKMSFFSPL